MDEFTMDEYIYVFVMFRWYYILQMSYCTLMLLTHFGETRRKDFWQMFIHHIVTLTLVFGSWITNTIRIGSLILVSNCEKWGSHYQIK